MQACKAHHARPCPAARAVRPQRAPRLRVAALQAGVADHTARVRGTAQLVSWYCSDLSSWPEWSPVTKGAVKLGVASDLVERGCKFELKQELWGILSYPMHYEVVDFEPGKRLVLSGISEYHTETSQFLFMPDRTDPGMTIVRCVTDAQLREWRSALQPVVSKLLERVPEDSMAGLQKLLNGPRSPLYTPEFQEAWRRHVSASADARKGRKPAGGGAGAARARAQQREPRVGVFTWGAAFDGLLSGGREARRAAEHTATQHYQSPAGPQDPAGHYAALGISVASGGPGPTGEEIRGAYRRLALELHPDRQIGKAAHVQKQAAGRFARVLRAYDALKDPETRRLYDAGQIIEETVSL